jgi:4-hydroxybenzoate polyprenyltransferase
MRLNKPIGIYLVLWPALWSLVVTHNGDLHFFYIFVFTLGAILMRSAGCAINDLADSDFDKNVPRTAKRVLAQRKIKLSSVYLIIFLLLLLSFLLVLLLPLESILWAILAVTLTIIYPFSKRFFVMPQLFLGLAFACSVPMAFATNPNYELTIVLLIFLATVFWTIAYDTLYAMADKKYDLKIGIRSSAIFFGKYDRYFVIFFHSLSLVCLFTTGVLLDLQIYFFMILSLSFLSIYYQNKLSMSGKIDKMIKAFSFNNYHGIITLVAFYVGYLG